MIDDFYITLLNKHSQLNSYQNNCSRKYKRKIIIRDYEYRYI